jgi:hypothetical protein
LNGVIPADILIELRDTKAFTSFPRTGKNRKGSKILASYLNWRALIMFDTPQFCMWFISFSVFLWLKISIYIIPNFMSNFLLIEKFCTWFISLSVFLWLKIIIDIIPKFMPNFLLIEKCIMNKFCYCEKFQFITI